MLPEQRAVIAAADAVCAADPIQAGVRDELLRLESVGTEDGFNERDITNTHLYQVIVNRIDGEVASVPMQMMSRVLRYFTVSLESSVPEALDLVSMAMAHPEMNMPINDATRAAIQAALSEYTFSDGWELYGIGLISLAHSVRADHVPDGADTMEDLAGNPHVVPVWFTNVVGVDSRVWSVLHQEGYDVVYGTTGPDEPAMGVDGLEALTRLLNAVTIQ